MPGLTLLARQLLFSRDYNEYVGPDHRHAGSKGDRDLGRPDVFLCELLFSNQLKST